MQGTSLWFSGRILWLALFIISAAGCSAAPVSEQGQPAEGEVSLTESGLTLQPVSLYGDPDMALGAVLQAQNTALLVCDRQVRRPQSQKPLVLYLDGELEYLSYAGEAGGGCFHYRADSAQLRRIAVSKTAILRLFFEREVYEHRISGTVSDYFSRPRFYGPQSRILEFVERLPLDGQLLKTSANQFVEG